MSQLATTIMKAPLASYSSEEEFRSTILSSMVNSGQAILNGIQNGDLLRYEPVYSQDETHWIATFTIEWISEEVHNSYDAIPAIAAERSFVDSLFEVERQFLDV